MEIILVNEGKSICIWIHQFKYSVHKQQLNALILINTSIDSHLNFKNESLLVLHLIDK